MSSTLRFLLLVLPLLLGVTASPAADDFLPPEKAFQATARAADPATVEVGFEIAPGYYMYREQFRFSAEGATLGTVEVPAGKVKFDDTFQKNVETYRGRIAIRVPVTAAQGPARLTVVSQGCADQGLCYPPMASVVNADMAAFGGNGDVRVVSTGGLPPAPGSVAVATIVTSSTATAEAGTAAEGAVIEAALRSGRFWSVVAVFFAAGVLLSFTPCVLPMLPILSSIIVGQGGTHVSRSRGLLLAASYSLGMALVYTALGVAAGLAGEGLAAALQTPWVLGAFAAVLALLALSMFGAYELQLPAAWHNRLSSTSQQLAAGRIAGVFGMGGLSALIVSPCVAAPLAGALLYISQTRDVVLGGGALFMLAAGMSVPLLLLGASAGSLLPRAGAWMEVVKRFFGLMLLAVAIWIVQPVLPQPLALALWGALLVASAMLLVFAKQGTTTSWWRRAAGAVVGVFGLMQLVGAASGGDDPLQPLAHLAARGATSSPAARAEAVRFQPVRSVAELDAMVAGAGRPVMLDFYADWCVSCKEMERFTFTDPRVRERLDRALLLKADVTRNTPEDRELLRRFSLFGPPGTLFFDAQGREITGVRVIGYQDSDRFLATLAAAGI